MGKIITLGWPLYYTPLPLIGQSSPNFIGNSLLLNILACLCRFKCFARCRRERHLLLSTVSPLHSSHRTCQHRARSKESTVDGILSGDKIFANLFAQIQVGRFFQHCKNISFFPYLPTKFSYFSPLTFQSLTLFNILNVRAFLWSLKTR